MSQREWVEKALESAVDAEGEDLAAAGATGVTIQQAEQIVEQFTGWEIAQ